MKEHAKVTKWTWRTGCVLVILLLAWFLARATFFMLAEPRLPVPGALPVGNATEAQGGQTSVASIMARNLFGVQSAPEASDRKTTNAKHDKTTAQETRAPNLLDDLNALPLSTRGWKLLGTIVSADPAASRAVIALSGGQKSYGEGDNIDDSVVDVIRRKTVVVRKGGQRERLELDTGEKDQIQRAQSTEAAPRDTSSPNNIVRKLTGGSLDPVALLRDISLKPRSLGALQGMEITTLKTGSPLHDLGLRTADLVLSVNDIPIQSFDDLAKLIAVVDSQTMRVKLIRNGVELALE